LELSVQIHFYMHHACNPEFSSLSQFIALAWSDTHTIVKMLIVWSIYVNTICYVLCER